VKSFCIMTRANSITDDNITDADEILAGIVALTIEETEADWRSVRSLSIRNRYIITRGQALLDHKRGITN